MQTFLPYPNFVKSAICLDWKRLGKQRVEAYQILNIINDSSYQGSWSHHPAILMWIGYDEALKLYFNIISTEWVNRGYNHNMSFFKINYDLLNMPYWLGDWRLHLSHQSNLLRKNNSWYSQFFDGPNDWPYYWPSQHKMIG